MAGAGFKTFTAGDVLTATQVNTYLMQQSVMVFATAAARTTALPSPSEGMMTNLADDNRIEMYDGAAWKIVYLPPTAYTPTATNYTRTSGQLQYTVSAHTMNIFGRIVVSAVSGGIQFTIPTGFTINSSISANDVIGSARFASGGTNYQGQAQFQSTTSIRLMALLASGTYVNEANTSSTVPGTWAAANNFSVACSFPLA
jgi:hypothetical protein